MEALKRPAKKKKKKRKKVGQSKRLETPGLKISPTPALVISILFEYAAKNNLPEGTFESLTFENNVLFTHSDNWTI